MIILDVKNKKIKEDTNCFIEIDGKETNVNILVKKDDFFVYSKKENPKEKFLAYIDECNIQKKSDIEIKKEEIINIELTKSLYTGTKNASFINDYIKNKSESITTLEFSLINKDNKVVITSSFIKGLLDQLLKTNIKNIIFKKDIFYDYDYLNEFTRALLR